MHTPNSLIIDLHQLTCRVLLAVSFASSAVVFAFMARFSVVSKVAAASSDLLLAELISRSIFVMLASARSASALEVSMISLNF